LRVFIASGEVSGDLAGAGLAMALRHRVPDLEVFGIGGARMEESGVEIDYATNHLGRVGVSEALTAVAPLWQAFRQVRKRVRSTPPDVAVLIGNDVFSVLLARWFRARKIPIVSYFPPQVWIWGAFAGTIVRSFDQVLSCFPQEQLVYERANSRNGSLTTFVGHYLADRVDQRTPENIAAARRRYGLENAQRIVCLMPGSRLQEVKSLAPVLFAAARELGDWDEDLRFLVPIADPRFRLAVAAEIERWSLGKRILMVESSLDALSASDLVLMSSGTASLEAALLGVPMVIAYRVSAITQLTVNTAIRVGLMAADTVGLPNLILGRDVVPELKQGEVTAANIVHEARSILEGAERRRQMKVAFEEISSRIKGPDSFEQVADAVLALATRSTRRLADQSVGSLTVGRDHGPGGRRQQYSDGRFFAPGSSVESGS
jgi:lipid-A-disaccharide synthase